MKSSLACHVNPLRHRHVRLLCVAGFLLAFSARAEDYIPQPAPAQRYDGLASHSPFAPPTGPPPAPVATPPPPPSPSWSDNLTVTSLMQNGTVYTATVVEKDSAARYLVRSDQENPDNHLVLASVNWADKPDAIKVTMRKGTQFGEVHFDPSAAGPSSGPGPGAPPGLPPRPAPPVNFHPPPIPGALPNPPPGQPGNPVRGRPVIRANPLPASAAPVRSVVTAPNVQGRAPVKAANDDDDDDND